MIVVHIGFPKTGSTTIQTFLDANDEALLGMSIDYTRLGRHERKGHHQLVHELKGMAARVNPLSGGVADVGERARVSGHRTTIISSEIFSACDGDEVRRLHAALSPAGQSFRIVLYIRDLLGFVPSSYAQKIRYGVNTYDFDEFFETRKSERRFEQFEVAERWAGVFGWDALKVRVLDPALLLNGDLIDDFLATADLDPDLPQLRALPRQARVNESAGWKTIEAIRALFGGYSSLKKKNNIVRLLNSDINEYKRKLIGMCAEDVAPVLNWVKDKGQYLTRTQATILLDSHTQSIKKLNEYLPIKIPEPLSLDARGFIERPFLPNASFIPKSELKTFYELLEEKMRTVPRLARVMPG
jgi:hypothetical protein